MKTDTLQPSRRPPALSSSNGWTPRAECVMPTRVSLPVGVRAAAFSGYVRAVVEAEDIIAWARRPAVAVLEAPATLPRSMPRKTVKAYLSILIA